MLVVNLFFPLEFILSLAPRGPILILEDFFLN
nr:MAG TPA: hypothetical protein [Caudoviricetes sp.]